MRQQNLRYLLSRYTGIGSRRISREEPAVRPPVTLPVGHPYLGLRNHWYLVCTGAELGAGPKAMRLLGEDLVLWRDGSGQPRLMPDHCPHRGAKLSIGDVVDGELQCWYHFWRFDGDGQCTSIPTQGGTCSLQERTTVGAAYPAVEQAGFIWAWIGEDEPTELQLPHELSDPSYAMFPESVEWATNWLLALENLADVMHAPFLHNQSLTLGRGVVEDTVRVEDTVDGFRVERQNQLGANFDWIEFGLGGVFFTRLDIPYRASFAGPGPDLRILGFATPIDDTHTQVHFPRLRQVDGWQRSLWQTLFRLRLRGTHLHVLNQDKAMLESMRSVPEAHRDEHLAQADKPVLHLRRALRPEFDRQLDGLGEGWAQSVALAGTKSSTSGPEPASDREGRTKSQNESARVKERTQ